jgi:hypothetical protein
MLGKPPPDVGARIESTETTWWAALLVLSPFLAETLDLKYGNDVWQCSEDDRYNWLALVLGLLASVSPAEEFFATSPCSKLKPLCTETVRESLTDWLKLFLPNDGKLLWEECPFTVTPDNSGKNSEQ